MLLPLPSPKLNQISLPPLPTPSRKLQAGQVLDAHARGLVHLDAVAPVGLSALTGRPEVLFGRGAAALWRTGLGPVDDDAIAIHSPYVDARRS